jgi:hypothetical protein
MLISGAPENIYEKFGFLSERQVPSLYFKGIEQNSNIVGRKLRENQLED